jgi:hypothetical protein
MISNAKNEMMSPEEYRNVANSPTQQAAAQVYPIYQSILKEASALDFDDLINRTVSMLQAHREVREKLQHQFRYIMIDEYQDTNTAQYKLVKLLTKPGEQHRCRRRRLAVYIQLARCRFPEHPELRAGLPRLHGHQAGAELPEYQAHTGCRPQRYHQEPAAQRKGALDGSRQRAASPDTAGPE